MPALRSSKRLNPVLAPSSEPSPLAEKSASPSPPPKSPRQEPYPIKVFKASRLGRALKKLYDDNLVVEFKTFPEEANVPLPPDPRPPPLTLKDLECVRLLGAGTDQVLLVRNTRTEKHRYDMPCVMALKAKRKRNYRTHAMEFLPRDGGDEDVEPAGVESTYRAHYTGMNAEKIILVNMEWSPWVTGLFQTFHDSARIYLGLECIQGGTFRSLLQAAHPRGLKVSDARFYFANIALGLEFLEDNDIVHCDLKPDNILIGGDGYLVLTDFGIAASTQNDDADWTQMGTPYYMAPENNLMYTLEHRGVYPHAIDWWSSGVMLYEMLTGKLPFCGPTTFQTEDLTLQGEWEWPEGFKVGPKLDDLIAGLLALKPSERLGSNTARQVQAHPWFQPVDWDNMDRRRYAAPYIPQACDPAERWNSLPMPNQADFPDLPVANLPLHLTHDNRFPQRVMLDD